MSLTLADTVFAGVHEDGINDFLRAFFGARPRHLVYGTPAFVPTTTVAATSIPPIAFPGVAGGIDFAIAFSIPEVDLHPDSSGGAWPIKPDPGEFTLRTEVGLVLACQRGRRRPNDERPPFEPIGVKLEVYARGRPDVVTFGMGNGEIRLLLEQIEIVDIRPDELESVIECLILMMLRAALQNFVLPFGALSLEFITLVLKNGPLIADDQLKVWGDVA